MTEFPVPTATSTPTAIAAGPDGNLWFTELTGNKIGRVGAAAVDVPTLGYPMAALLAIAIAAAGFLLLDKSS